MTAHTYVPFTEHRVFLSPKDLRALADKFEQEGPKTLAGQNLPRSMYFDDKDNSMIVIICDQEWIHALRNTA